MDQLSLDDANALAYQYAPPESSGVTFVFFNALTGDLNHWESTIAPPLRQAGCGTLSWNYRGQAHTRWAPEVSLGAVTAIADAQRLLTAVAPPRPVLVGLSIGGLFAARAWLGGATAEQLVLINTLRQPGPRLAWINDALVRCAEVGGLQLVRDLYGMLLFNDAWLAEHRAEFLTTAPYQPLAAGDGAYRLLKDSRDADWDLPLERFTAPVTVVTGLRDGLFLDREVVADQCRRLPQVSRVDLVDAAHMVPLERPQALVDILLNLSGAQL
ncbi:MAG: alpha/beta fold hydrolase [Candidatus Competibacterales bacterium]